MANGAPGAPSVAISQHETSYDLSCDFVTPPADPDGDTLSLELRWLLNGDVTPFTGAQLPGSEVYVGDSWACEARASRCDQPLGADLVEAE